MAAHLSGKTYVLRAKLRNTPSLSFDFGDEACTLTYRLLGGGKRRGKHHLTGGYGTWQEGMAVLGATHAPTRGCERRVDLPRIPLR